MSDGDHRRARRLARPARPQHRADLPGDLQLAAAAGAGRAARLGRAAAPAAGHRTGARSPSSSSASPNSRRAWPRAAPREAAIRAWSTSAWRGRAWTSAPSTSCARSAPRTGGLTLEEFKQMLREQFFGLLLDRDGRAGRDPADAARRRRRPREGARQHPARRVAPPARSSGERAERLAQIETLSGRRRAEACRRSRRRAGSVAGRSRPSRPEE